jgi:hypothetical protein
VPVGRDQLPRCEVERPAGKAHAVRGTVRPGQGARAAQNAVDACQQLARVERLGEVVVRAHLQADDAVDLVAARREHDYRQPGARSQVAAQAQAVLARQHDIEHDEVGAARLQDAPHLAAVGGARDAKAVALEVIAQQPADFGVVIDDEDVCRLLHGRAISHLAAGPVKTPCNAM